MNNTERRSKEKIINIEIYTDGSCKKVGKEMTFGGWGYLVILDGKEIYEASGSEYKTTNQRMELTAVSEALKYIQTIRRPSEKVIIYSDSAYVINCYTQNWYINWMHNGWVNTKQEPVANQDLWWNIIPFFDNFWYTFRKVKGHADNFWNNKCDELVQREAENLKRNWRGEQKYD